MDRLYLNLQQVMAEATSVLQILGLNFYCVIVLCVLFSKLQCIDFTIIVRIVSLEFSYFGNSIRQIDVVPVIRGEPNLILTGHRFWSH